MARFVSVTLNPAVDISTSVKNIAPLHKLRCAPPQRDPGGGGINVARVLRRLNNDVVAIYPIGGPTGQLLKQLVDEEGVRSVAVETTSITREDFTVLEANTLDQYRFVFPGSWLDQAGWRAICEAISRESVRPNFIVASGSLPPGAPADAYAQIARMANKASLRAAIDTSGAALENALEEGVYLIKPNLRELSDLLGQKLEDEPSQLAACRQLVASGRAAIVTLTLGALGALAVTKNGAWRAHAPSVKVNSAVGAGDSFLAAMISALSIDKSVKQSLRFAVAAGTAALLSPGTDLCRPSDVERLVKEVIVQDIII